MIKRILSSLFIFSMIATQAYANMWLGLGWREDNLHWTIAGPGGVPNILSELEWNQIKMWEIAAGYYGPLGNFEYLKFNADYAKVYSGKNVDSDYLENDRRALFSQSRNSANHGEAFDFSFGIGYPISKCWDPIDIVPVVGVALMEQHFTMRKGDQTFDSLTGIVGPIEGLHSHYYSRSTTTWIGFDINIEPTYEVSYQLGFQYHVGNYRAKGHWNLRTDFVKDFRHTGVIKGVLLTAAVNSRLFEQFSVGARIEYNDMHLHHGHDRLYFYDDDGISIVKYKTRLNNVYWRSFKILATLAYEF